MTLTSSSFNQLREKSSQMDKHVISQYHHLSQQSSQLASMLPGSAPQFKYENENRESEVKEGSVLRSLLSTPPRSAPLPPPTRPANQARERLLEPEAEWSSPIRVPFDGHRRVKWTWTSAKENEDHLAVSNSQTGTNSVVFHPDCANGKFACFETFAAMGDRPLRKNAFTYWEVEVSSRTLSNATSVMFGVGTKQASTQAVGYLNLIGIDRCSWGLANSGQLWHDSKSAVYCQHLGSSDQTDVVVGLLYDGFSGQLAFYVNGAFKGRAFAGLGQSGAKVFPMISSTASNSRFRMGPVHESMPTLQDLCRDTITASMSPSSWSQQNLPKSIVEFLQ